MATKTSKILHFYDLDFLEEKDKKKFTDKNYYKTIKVSLR